MELQTTSIYGFTAFWDCFESHLNTSASTSSDTVYSI